MGLWRTELNNERVKKECPELMAYIGKNYIKVKIWFIHNCKLIQDIKDFTIKIDRVPCIGFSFENKTMFAEFDKANFCVFIKDYNKFTAKQKMDEAFRDTFEKGPICEYHNGYIEYAIEDFGQTDEQLINECIKSLKNNLHNVLTVLLNKQKKLNNEIEAIKNFIN